MHLLAKTSILGLVAFAMALLPSPVLPAGSNSSEIRQYQGVKLSPFDRDYDNSIQGPQKVDIKKYRLIVTGLVVKPLSLTYQEVLSLPRVTRVVTMPCVEGWDERLLYEGVLLSDIFALAQPKAGAAYAAFFAADGYSSALPLKYLQDSKALLGFKINGLVLDEKRGFPFQVVAEKKLGYKWVKWVTRIELKEKAYLGYWEKRGYDDKADVKK